MSANFTLEISKIRAVSLAMAETDIRYYLNGMLIEHNGAETRIVATDGHRLHAIRVDHDSLVIDPVSAIIPNSMIKTIIKAKAPRGARYPAQVTITIDGNWICARLPDGTENIATAVDGTFPDYRLILPKIVASMVPATYQPRYLVDAVLAHNLHTGCELDNPVAWAQNGDNCGFISAPGFIAVVMPVRGSAISVNTDPGNDFAPMLQAPECAA